MPACRLDPPATIRYQDQDLVRIGDENIGMLVAPGAGGRLVRWWHHGIDLLYWPDPADWSRPAKIRGGNPLLFPFLGRHFVDGQPGHWRDMHGAVRALPQHGFARDLPFAIAAIEAAAITMTLRDSAASRAGYPFAFAFDVGYRLRPEGLEAVFTVHNPGDTPLPFYAGHHFYFALPAALRAQSRLTLPRTTRVRQQPDGQLTPGETGDLAYALDDPRLQDTFHRFTAGSDGTALSMPGWGDRPPLTLEFLLPAAADSQAPTPARVAPWRAITTWSEREDADFYCVEPWLALPDAIHRAEALWVKPGETMRAVCQLRVRLQQTI